MPHDPITGRDTSSNSGAHAAVVEQVHPSTLPNCDEESCACLVSWLNAEASGLVRPGARALVVGCGLGDNVYELQSRGYDAEGFDASPIVVEQARLRHPELSDRLFAADLLEPPTTHLSRHDLVVDIETLNFIAAESQPSAIASLCALAKPHGIVMLVANRDPDRAARFGLAPEALLDAMHTLGFEPTRSPDEYDDDRTPARRRIRAAFRRR